MGGLGFLCYAELETRTLSWFLVFNGGKPGQADCPVAMGVGMGVGESSASSPGVAWGSQAVGRLGKDLQARQGTRKFFKPVVGALLPPCGNWSSNQLTRLQGTVSNCLDLPQFPCG